MRWSPAWTLVVAALLSASPAAGQLGGSSDLTDLLGRIGARVEEYYARARTIVCIESVVLQPLAHDLTADGRARRLVYELRVEWEPLLCGRAGRRKQRRQAGRAGGLSGGCSPSTAGRRARRTSPAAWTRGTSPPSPWPCCFRAGARIRLCAGRDGRHRRTSQRETRLPADREHAAGD